MLSTNLKRRIREAGFEMCFNPPSDGDCFYSSAAYQMGISTVEAKEQVFDYLQNNRIDVSTLA